MRRVVAALMPFLIGLPAWAEPFTIDSVFVDQVEQISRIDPDGTITEYAPTFTGFDGFVGIEFDRPNDRVVFIANDATGTRIGAIDADLDPTSVVTLRPGLPAGAQGIDVDPGSGRLFWWEHSALGMGPIKSVPGNGIGLPVVEALSVPEPYTLEVDAGRGFFVCSTGLDTAEPLIGVGPLDGTASTVTHAPQLSSLAGPYDIAIDPISGDIHWTEIGAMATVFRSNPSFTTVEIVLEVDYSGAPLPTLLQSLDVVGDQVVVQEFDLSAGDAALRVYDTTTGDVRTVSDPLGTTFFALEADYTIDPITEQPVGALVESGSNTALSVMSLDPTATFEWRRAGIPMVDDARVFGAQTDTLTFMPALLEDTNVYTCIVTDGGGAGQLSDDALLAVRPGPGGVCVADLDGNGILNLDDIDAFVAGFLGGCP